MPLVAVYADNDGQFRFLTLPTSSVIDLIDNPGGPGLTRIRYNGRQLEAFMCDIEERAVRLQDNPLSV